MIARVINKSAHNSFLAKYSNGLCEEETTRVNEVVSLICLNNSELGAKKGGQPKNNFKLSSQVALAGIEPAS